MDRRAKRRVRIVNSAANIREFNAYVVNVHKDEIVHNYVLIDR